MLNKFDGMNTAIELTIDEVEKHALRLIQAGGDNGRANGQSKVCFLCTSSVDPLIINDRKRGGVLVGAHHQGGDCGPGNVP